MDTISAISIARAFAYGDNRECTMHIPGNEPRGGMDAETHWSNTGTSVNHFCGKLLLLRDVMNTDMAKRMASACYDYTAGFLNGFMTK